MGSSGDLANSAERKLDDEKKRCDWRFTDNTPLIAACLLTGAVVLGVHYISICKDRTDISLPTLMESIESKCRSLGDAFNASAPESVLHPVPTQIGVAIWVAREEWSLPVHDTLDRIEKVVSGAGNRKQQFIQRIVRVSKLGSDGNLEKSSSSSTKWGGSSKVSQDPLANAAIKQQLGLSVAKHAYAVSLKEELLMHTISFFAAPPSAAKSVRCFLFDDKRAYCTVSTEMGMETTKREVEAAVATLLANWLEIENFRDANATQRWAMMRKVRGCHYALRALRQLKMSVDAHPEMPVPEGVRGAADRLEKLVRESDFTKLARAAADLQFHQLLLPQIYIPWDQAVVNHLSILMPVYGVITLAVRLIKENRKRAQVVQNS